MASDTTSTPIDRRTAMALGAASVMAGLRPAQARVLGLELGPATPFSFEALIVRARDLAGRSHIAPPVPAPEVLDEIDYDAHGKIRFRAENALFASAQQADPGQPPDIEPGAFPATFFHLGRFFKKPQRIHVVQEAPGRPTVAREIVYREDYFDKPADSPARRLPRGAGFAGFRFQEQRAPGRAGWQGRPLPWQTNDWVAFLGASYFRAIGDEYQYGLSARGIMVDAAVAGTAEEFPDFTHVWLHQPKGGAEGVTAFALLDGPSLTGAFRFDMVRDRGVRMEITKHLFLRKDIARFGVAPLTSMYWYSEKAKQTAVDWRPEVHDSDGLAIWTGAGERIWRPLNNPARTVASSFGDNNPRGFGLMQRDRSFANYMDGVHYERRPSLWIEPVGDWGRGAVQLIEIPTDDEIHDNIVAAWVPAEPARAGNSYTFRYRAHWHADEPAPPPLARCIATRMGNGGQPGQPRPQGVRKFMLEFKGPPLEAIPFGQKPEVVLSASRGMFSYIFTEAVPNDVAGHWRAQFDFTAGAGDGPIEMRAYLRMGGQVLSESWLYQYHPF
jgi:glucans biosynthesis protein